jgi:hypothetical protein
MARRGVFAAVLAVGCRAAFGSATAMQVRGTKVHRLRLGVESRCRQVESTIGIAVKRWMRKCIMIEKLYLHDYAKTKKNSSHP